MDMDNVKCMCHLCCLYGLSCLRYLYHLWSLHCLCCLCAVNVIYVDVVYIIYPAIYDSVVGKYLIFIFDFLNISYSECLLKFIIFYAVCFMMYRDMQFITGILYQGMLSRS